MGQVTDFVLLGLFLGLSAAPAIYGLHLYALAVAAGLRRGSVRARQAAQVGAFAERAAAQGWPHVTVQLPIYNERAVAERVLRAVAALDYPRDRLEIQVLDDSTDITRAMIDRTARRLRAQGCDVKVVRRTDRTHYKAGALAAALPAARGEFIAIFDADFVPEADFLRRLIPLFDGAPDVACVQGRWGHLNRDANWLTQGLSLGMDGHFGVEQGGRAWNGLLLNFNGTAGVWRRSAIEDPRVGGWSGDTITEDLDLSYRAQLAGWRIEYCDQVAAPAEIPARSDAVKAQQRRWATGSIQTARKILPAVWRSSLTLTQKLEATVHLTQYAVNVFILLMLVLGRSLLWLLPIDQYSNWLFTVLAIAGVSAAAPTVSYLYARRALTGRWARPLEVLKLIVLGLGLSLNNSVAVLIGLAQRGGEFVRTPKTGAAGEKAGPDVYRVAPSRLWLWELVIGAYCALQWVLFLPIDYGIGGVFQLLMAVGLIRLGWGSRPRRIPRRAAAREAARTATQHEAEVPRPDATSL